MNYSINSFTGASEAKLLVQGILFCQGWWFFRFFLKKPKNQIFSLKIEKKREKTNEFCFLLVLTGFLLVFFWF